MPAINDNTSALDALFDLEFNGLLAIIDDMLSIRCRINNIHTQNVLVVIGIDDFFSVLKVKTESWDCRHCQQVQ